MQHKVNGSPRKIRYGGPENFTRSPGVLPLQLLDLALGLVWPLVCSERV